MPDLPQGSLSFRPEKSYQREADESEKKWEGSFRNKTNDERDELTTNEGDKWCPREDKAGGELIVVCSF